MVNLLSHKITGEEDFKEDIEVVLENEDVVEVDILIEIEIGKKIMKKVIKIPL